MIRLERLHVRYGRFALADVDLHIPQGQYAVLMGKTGCGKTTLLEVICGLRRPDGGRVWIADTDCTRFKPGQRGIGYVPQDRALFDHLNVHDHLAFALRLRRWDRVRIQARVEEMAEMLEIGHLLNRLPQGLSGGESQRVALGRALAAGPSILVLDEPLSALDEETRESMCALLRDLHLQSGVTVLHVTHSRAECAAVGGSLIRMLEGRIEYDATQN